LYAVLSSQIGCPAAQESQKPSRGQKMLGLQKMQKILGVFSTDEEEEEAISQYAISYCS
jgi:hypothetical protein